MNTSSLKKVFGNSAWLIASRIINIVVGLIVSVCITRYLGAEQKGAMAEAQAIASFWAFFASLGLLDILISKFSGCRNESGTIATTGMILMLLGGILTFSLGIVSAIVLNVDRDVLIYVAVCGSVYLFQWLSVYEYWFYSNSCSKYYAIAQSIIHIVFMGIRFIGVPLKAPLLYFIAAATIEAIAIFLSLILCYRTAKCPLVGPRVFDRKIAKELIVLAFPMVIMGFATTIYMKVDQIMVGEMIGKTELGQYSVAVTLAEYWYFIPATIYSSFLPIITESYEDGKNFTDCLQQFADIIVFIGYVAVVGVMLFGYWGIVLLYGKEFEYSAYILMAYIWTGVFTCLSYSGQAYYILHGDTKTIMWINLIGAVLNFIFNFILIRVFGCIGAAVATLAEYIVVAFGQMIVLRYKYGDLYRVQLKSFFPFVRLVSYLKNGLLLGVDK